VAEFLRQKGERVRWSVVEEVHEGGAALLPEIELRLDELEGLIRQAPDRATRQSLQTEQGNLLELRDEKRAEAPIVTQRWDGNTQMFGDDRAEAVAETVEDRRAVLDDALATVWCGSCVAVQVAGRPEGSCRGWCSTGRCPRTSVPSKLPTTRHSPAEQAEIDTD
jgi:hypothetical protein